MATTSRRSPANQPLNFAAITTEVARSREILSWGDDWDGEGSPGYAETTWQRAADFLLQNSAELWEEQRVSPRITPGPRSSIDIHLQTAQRELLINIPVAEHEPADFYGDSTSGEIIKGKLDTSISNKWLLLWLMR